MHTIFGPGNPINQAGSHFTLQVDVSVRDPKPLSKVTKVSKGGSADPFASALLAAKDKAKRHASKVTVVDCSFPQLLTQQILNIVEYQ